MGFNAVWVRVWASLKDIPLLMMRLVLAYGFLIPALRKWKDINAIGDWFAQLHIILPYTNAYVVAICESLGVVLLSLGLFVRYITIPLMISMIVAIATVHWQNGFEAGNNGFEIPLYYFIMLFTLLAYGAGRLSFDHLIFNERKKNRKMKGSWR
ncbi:DoxX family protein [Chitinophaga sp. Cy-1792]|uniref:HvfX family Cu-binding RiPP maturation protein n=1 Tax=Chitinophaga sp. Cy-1792 TaxID=2608339 RepID=UPI00141F4441|nr:DoxX family protein [Chitinophaga sp. Cy-1792]NIG53796.1 DoxX family protein [Chitinophaga sp. Cy-1792]